MPDSTNFFEYLTNENPYAFLRNYQDHPFKKDQIKLKLDAIQKIQPKFVPCILNDETTTIERSSLVNFVIRNGLNENISKGAAILDKHNITHNIYNYKLINQSNLSELESKASDLQDIGFDFNFVYKERYNFSALNYILEIFKSYIDLKEMEDIVLDICRLKLINKQKILREKVYTAVQEKLDDESIIQIKLDEIEENSVEEAKRFLSLKKKYSEL